jgi:hypothetical protein
LCSFDDGEIGGSTTEDSAIGTEGRSSLAPMSSSSECLDVIDPRILADSERLVVEREVWSLLRMGRVSVAIRRPVDFSWSGDDSGVQLRRYQLNDTV